MSDPKFDPTDTNTGRFVLKAVGNGGGSVPTKDFAPVEKTAKVAAEVANTFAIAKTWIGRDSDSPIVAESVKRRENVGVLTTIAYGRIRT